jgi:hypothetical protein
MQLSNGSELVTLAALLALYCQNGTMLPALLLPLLGNRGFTVSQELRREPNLQLSVKPLFAESKCFGSRRRTRPR